MPRADPITPRLGGHSALARPSASLAGAGVSHYRVTTGGSSQRAFEHITLSIASETARGKTVQIGNRPQFRTEEIFCLLFTVID